jgi:hypothetical protein
MNEIDYLDVTPPPVSVLQFEKETAERASRGESPPPCQICEILLSWFLNPPRKNQTMHLGTFEEAIASPCSQHTAILKHLHDYSRHDLRRPQRLVRDYFGVHVGGLSSKNLVLADHLGHRAKLRVLDQEWVDVPVISQWRDHCFKSHGESCENPMKIMRVVPDLLVDVRRKCLVEGTKSHRYMALSYRLGKATPFFLRLRELNKFGRDGVLADAQVLRKIPLTVRHAIMLAGQLGYEYLWTDVLCIVHDGPLPLADQLNKMSAIYASAATTIVATDGDGSDGIPGLRGISGPRDLQQATFAIRDEYLIIVGREETELTNAHIDYNLRGWTYQEYIMSSRKLVFMNQQAHWFCRCHRRDESDGRVWDHLSHINYENLGPSQFIRLGCPDLTQASELLSWYNRRDLTYPGDALAAIAGLLAVLSRGFEGGFLYGIPERFFDVALGWRPSFYGLGDARVEKTCRQRRGPSLDWRTTVVASEMPSWSWTAWQGGFSFGHSEVAQVGEHSYRGHAFCETSPITEWYTASTSPGCNRRRIMSDWHVDRNDVDDQDKVLPEGWSRMEASEAFRPLWDSSQPPRHFWRPVIYRHQGSKTGDPRFWYYPFRMPEINESTPSKVPKQTRFLFCQTWKASVLLGDLRSRKRPRDNNLNMTLWADDLGSCDEGSRIGEVFLHFAEQFEEETDDITKAYGRRAVVDVVAISRSSFSVGQRSGHHEYRDEELWSSKDRINILWVKWKQGIAYRVASGYVYEEDWDDLDLEEIDLVLG